MSSPRISTRVHIADSNPAMYGMFTACGKRVNIRSFRTVHSGASIQTDVTCKACQIALRGTAKGIVPTVKQAIEKVEATGWKLYNQARNWYVFENPDAPIEFRVLTFSLKELRDAYRNGF